MCGFIGGTASAVVRFAAVIFLCADCACLPAGRAWASDFFHMGPVEYFPGSKRSMREGFRQAQKIVDWREPVSASLPPQPVVDFLDNPTLENARQYLAWQDEKMQRVLKAQEVLAAVEQEEQKH